MLLTVHFYQPAYISVTQVSNTFYFTFTICPEAKAEKDKINIRNVVPATEEEARHILERKDSKASQGIKVC